MTEQLYGVAVTFNRNYAGRDEHGVLKLSASGGGVLMTLSCAEALTKALKSEFPRATLRRVCVPRLRQALSGQKGDDCVVVH